METQQAKLFGMKLLFCRLHNHEGCKQILPYVKGRETESKKWKYVFSFHDGERLTARLNQVFASYIKRRICKKTAKFANNRSYFSQSKSEKTSKN